VPAVLGLTARIRSSGTDPRNQMDPAGQTLRGDHARVSYPITEALFRTIP